MADPSKFQNAFPGVRPLGISYSLGQGILHSDIPANPSDPSLPDDAYLVDFGEAVDGGIYDREGWTKETLATKLSELKARQDVREAYAAYKRNGPLPTDSEMEGAVDNIWDKADQIFKTRHVYFYDDISNYGNIMAHGTIYGMGAGSAMYLQIQGYSLSANAWALPKQWGESVPAYRQDFGTGQGHWKAVFSAGLWVNEHNGAIFTAITTVFLIGVTAASAGAATAIIPVLTPILGSVALATSVAGFLASTLVGAVKWLITGDSEAFARGVITEGANIPANMSKEDSEKLAAKFPATSAFVKGIGSTFKQINNQIEKSPELRALLNAGDSIGGFLKAAEKSVSLTNILGEKIIPKVGAEYYKAARDALGGLNSIGGAFFEKVKNAASVEAIKELHDLVPWYAKGYVLYAGVGRATELAQIKEQEDLDYQQRARLYAPAPKFSLLEAREQQAIRDAFAASDAYIAEQVKNHPLKAVAASTKEQILPVVQVTTLSHFADNRIPTPEYVEEVAPTSKKVIFALPLAILAAFLTVSWFKKKSD